MNDLSLFQYREFEYLLNEKDLWLPYYGGNKVRKFQKILRDIEDSGKNAIVTTGGIQSNHCRVAALVAARHKLKCVLILHGSEKSFQRQKGNALLMRLAGAEIRFAEPKRIGSDMDRAMKDLKTDGFDPYYVYGGGHNRAGVEAYIEYVYEMSKSIPESKIPDHIFLASGTGSTQAGIMLGANKAGWEHTVVHGISVGRNKKRGKEGVIESISMADQDNVNRNINFYDDYLFGGYGKSNKELLQMIDDVALKTGIILDACYSGKAFFGMLDIVNKSNLEGNIMFWHTGGILNRMA
jgi:D-cysteine desulfhydrase